MTLKNLLTLLTPANHKLAEALITRLALQQGLNPDRVVQQRPCGVDLDQ